MSEPSLFKQILNFLTPSFNQAAPAGVAASDLSFKEREALYQAQERRNLLAEGIRPNAAEKAEADAQMAKATLKMQCERDGAFDKVTGNTNVAACKPFVVTKAF